MAARSVSELLPRAFSELDRDDVATIVADHAEERETLYFERKAEVSRASLAKSCAAFANTAGGLLLVGVADETDDLGGIEPPAGEPQVWVKDVLRGHVLPLPPFRARFVPVDGDRVLLLVLVEESSTTPHLLTRSGAIYVRNPGSSDPVPIGDQRRLLDLLARGEKAREGALASARQIASEQAEHLADAPARFARITLALAPTGVAGWFAVRLLEDRASVQRLGAVFGDVANRELEHRRGSWEQYAVTVLRYFRRGIFPPEYFEAVSVRRDGATLFQRAVLEKAEYPHDYALTREGLMEWVAEKLRAGRDLLLEFGAHGDLAFALRLGSGRTLEWRDARSYDLATGEIHVEAWTSLSIAGDVERAFLDRVAAEIGRAMGLGPDPDTAA